MHRSTVQLLIYLLMIAITSMVAALLIAPWLPYPFPKILRRAATVTAALTLPYFVTRIQGRRWSALGLEPSARMSRQWILGVITGAAMFGLLLILLRMAGALVFHQPTGEGWARIIWFLPAAAAIAVLEEAFFRGVVLQSLLSDLGTVAAVLLSSAFYAVLHFAKYLAQPLAILPEMFGLFLLGCLLAYGYLRTGLLALPMGLHMSAAFLAKTDRHFIEFMGREPRWLFGTDRWLTGCLGWGVLLAAGLVIAALTRARPQGVEP